MKRLLIFENGLEWQTSGPGISIRMGGQEPTDELDIEGKSKSEVTKLKNQLKSKKVDEKKE